MLLANYFINDQLNTVTNKTNILNIFTILKYITVIDQKCLFSLGLWLSLVFFISFSLFFIIFFLSSYFVLSLLPTKFCFLIFCFVILNVDFLAIFLPVVVLKMHSLVFLSLFHFYSCYPPPAL